MDILNFLPAGQFKNKGGGEWAGPCPSCGGRDRFIVWPEHRSGSTGGRFLCRGCTPEGGDCIQFLRDFQGMSYPEACEALKVRPRQNDGALAVRPQAAARTWVPEPERLPSEMWRRRAATFLAECGAALDTEAARDTLRGRSLAFDFARRHGLGWNPADRYETPEAWGLEPWLNDKGNQGKIYLPAGLVVPTFRKTGSVAVKIRRRNWQPGDAWPKYQAIKGGGNGALILGKSGLPVVLVESELDALLIAQEASDLCAVMALGSASNRPHVAAADFLKSSPAILVALDFDKPDAKGQRAGARAWLWWKEHFQQARRWPPAIEKDPLEMHKAGVPVRVWIEAGFSERTRQDAPKTPELVRPEPMAELPAKEVRRSRTAPQRCLFCQHWREVPGSCWWVAACMVTGEKVSFRSACTLPGKAGKVLQ